MASKSTEGNQMTDQATPAQQPEDDAFARAHAIVTDQFAKVIRTDKENGELKAELHRVKGLLALANDRVTRQTDQLATEKADKEFYMRYAAAVEARFDQIFTTVSTAEDEIRQTGADLDKMTTLARQNADAAHQSSALLTTLRTMIDAARLDARNAAYRPKLEGPKNADQPIAGGDVRAEEIGRKFGAGTLKELEGQTRAGG
jgi:methyl-accepting chemotaxis protein